MECPLGSLAVLSQLRSRIQQLSWAEPSELALVTHLRGVTPRFGPAVCHAETGSGLWLALSVQDPQ